MWGKGEPWRAFYIGQHGGVEMWGPSQPLPLPAAARLLISPAAEVVEGQAVTLSCRSGLSPTPDARFSWYLNGALLHEGPSSSLLLSAASSTDAGSYHCWARDGHSASGPSSPAILTVLCEQPPPATASCWDPPTTPPPPPPTGPPTLSCPAPPQGLHQEAWVTGLATMGLSTWG